MQAPHNQLFAELEISSQIKRFYVGLDDRDYEAMAAVFAPDGCWTRAGVDVNGPEGLRKLLDERPLDRHSRHVVSNIIVDLNDDGTASMRCYNTAFVHTGPTGDRGAAPLELPSSLGLLSGIFTKVDDRWRLENLRSRPAFKKGIKL